MYGQTNEQAHKKTKHAIEAKCKTSTDKSKSYKKAKFIISERLTDRETDRKKERYKQTNTQSERQTNSQPDNGKSSQIV